MSRLIGRPASGSRCDYGQRPHRIRWTDRTGLQHEVLAVAVQDQWWQTPGPLREYRVWRLLIRRASLITVQEALWLPTDAQDRWWGERVED